MATGEGSIQQAFGQAWEVLPPDMQSAYENALLVQQARIVLAATALFGVMNESSVAETHVQALQDRLAGLHLSELEQLGEKIEGVAAQLKVSPYTPAESNAAVLSLVTSDAKVENPIAGTEVPAPAAGDKAAPSPVDGTVERSLLDETVIDGSSDEPEVAVVPDDSSEPEKFTPEQLPDEGPMTRHERQSLANIFGKAEADRLATLPREQINTVVAKLGEIYLAGNNKKTFAHSQLQRWMRHLDGLSDNDIAHEGDVTKSAVAQARYKLYAIISRANPSLDTLLGSGLPAASEVPMTAQTEVAPLEIVAAGHDTQVEDGEAKSADHPAETTPEGPTVEEVTSRLLEELAIIGDALGMSGREKQALRQRLSEEKEVLPLSREARSGLTSLVNKYHRLIAREQLELTTLEKEVFEKVTGCDEDHTTYPVATIVGMMHDELTAAKVSATHVILGTIQKMNEASRAAAAQS